MPEQAFDAYYQPVFEEVLDKLLLQHGSLQVTDVEFPN